MTIRNIPNKEYNFLVGFWNRACEILVEKPSKFIHEPIEEKTLNEMKENIVEAEKWSTDKKGKDIELNGNNIKYNSNRDSWSSIYGKTLCQAPNKYHLAFEIKNIPQNR